MNLERNHSDVGQGISSDDVWETVPQSEPCNPSAVYAVDTEEQHYECSNILGQDWLGNAVDEKLDSGDLSREAHLMMSKKQNHRLNPTSHVH